MSDDTRSVVKTNQALLTKVIPQPLEKLIEAALAKLKHAWLRENTTTGIQFFGDNDD